MKKENDIDVLDDAFLIKYIGHQWVSESIPDANHEQLKVLLYTAAKALMLINEKAGPMFDGWEINRLEKTVVSLKKISQLIGDYLDVEAGKRES